MTKPLYTLCDGEKAGVDIVQVLGGMYYHLVDTDSPFNNDSEKYEGCKCHVFIASPVFLCM